jgi:hypothetical protein
MNKLCFFLFFLAFSLVFINCGGSQSVSPTLVAKASTLVPAISAAAASSIRDNSTDPNFDLTGLGSMPVLIFGNYTKVLDISGNNNGVTSYNLGGVFSNAAAIVDSIPNTNTAAGTVNATWNGYTFPVTMSAIQATTSATVSPFDFGTRSGSTTYENLRTATATCTDPTLPYTGTMSTAWKIADNTFYLLYAEESNFSGTVSEKYVIQGNYNGDTGDLIYNQANHSATSSDRTRIEVTGNVNTKLGLIRVLVISGANKVSAVTKGIVGTGDTIMKAKLANGTALSSATEKWLCINSAASIPDFQAINFTSTDGSYASGKIQIASSSSGFTGTCASSTYIADIASESYFVETDLVDDATKYYSALK